MKDLTQRDLTNADTMLAMGPATWLLVWALLIMVLGGCLVAYVRFH
jgi:hypothetical protein